MLTITEPSEKYVSVELLESNKQRYKYLYTIADNSEDTLDLTYEKLILKLKIVEGELLYTKSIISSDGIEGTAKPIRFNKKTVR